MVLVAALRMMVMMMLTRSKKMTTPSLTPKRLNQNALKMEQVIRLCTWNSRGHAIDRLMYIERLLQHCDILLVQEHWLMDGDLHRLIAISPDELTVCGVSGMDPQHLLVGRPFGGCALIHKRNLRCSVTPFSVSSRRLFACSIELIDSLKFILCLTLPYMMVITCPITCPFF